MNLYMNAATGGYTVTDDTGRVYSPAEAEAAWNAGKVEDWNISFARFAAMNFDVDALKDYYRQVKS